MEKWQQLLSNRGILSAAVEAGWEPYGNGWRYPLYSRMGKIEGVYRWKNFDSSGSGMKYRWEPKDAPNRPVYYLLPDTIAAIEKANGEVIIASGEPDVLAFRASGAKNALCWFGEGNVPTTLAGDLQSFGVRSVQIYPDLDDTGDTFARKISDALRDSGIALDASRLPGAAGSKYDINRLWMDCAFNADKFWDSLVQQPAITFAAPTTNQDRIQDYKNASKAFWEAIERRLGITEYKDDDWSKAISCVLKKHEHDNSTPSAGWHRKKHVYSCFKCGIKDMKAEELGEQLGIRQADFLPKQAASKVKTTTAPRSAPLGAPRVVFSWQEATQSYVDDLLSDSPQGAESLPLAWANIRSFGGYANLIDAGKMIAFVGDSGDGKTTAIETQVDYWRRHGHTGIMWGPEWSMQAYVARAVQRNGGASVTQWRSHDTYKKLHARGVSDAKNYGEKMDDKLLERTVAVAKQIAAWPGKLYFIEKAGLPIESIAQHMRELVDRRLADGERISFVVFDYAQLMDTQANNDTERTKRALQKTKELCIDKQLVGIVGSQVTKMDGRAAANGAKNTQHSMQGARSDVFNLVITMSRKVDGNGEKLPDATWRVGKNSLGKNGDQPMILDTDLQLWKDGQAHHEEMRQPAYASNGNGYHDDDQIPF